MYARSGDVKSRSVAFAEVVERARSEGWPHEEFLVACLQREVSAREFHGGEGRVRAARFRAGKSLEEFDFGNARGLECDVITHPGTLDFIAGKENVVFLGPPAEWVARLAEAHHAGRLHAELTKLGRCPLMVVEVGYIPFEPRRRTCSSSWPRPTVWNRMSSGSYFPGPVRAVEIPKKGGTRVLGILKPCRDQLQVR